VFSEPGGRQKGTVDAAIKDFAFNLCLGRDTEDFQAISQSNSLD
jgi:hypothetical protein